MRRRLALLLALASVLAVALPAARAASTADPLRTRQWALAQVHAPQAWARTTGRGAVVAVIGSGVDLGHPDLAGALVPGRTFLGCGAGCGNGDRLSGPASRRASATDEGTVLAGVVAARAGNGRGIAGVAPGAQVLPIKVSDARGAAVGDVVRALDLATARRVDVALLAVDLPATVSTDAAFVGALRRATFHGVTVVAGAGDAPGAGCQGVAAATYVLCVTSTDRREAVVPGTSTPGKSDLYSVAAPGGLPLVGCDEAVLSTVPRASAGTCPAGAGYGTSQGTAVAAAHVAGVAALLYAQRHYRTDIVAAMTHTSRQPGSGVRGAWTPAYGYGVVDAVAATGYRP